MGARAKDSSVEMGAIVPRGVGLRSGGVGIAGVKRGGATINPRRDQGGPVGVVAPGVVAGEITVA